MNQKTAKQMAGPVCNPIDSGKICERFSIEGIHKRNIWYKANPPIQVCMPNQPQATIALNMAGMFAPFTPKLARANTGNGIPYLAPALPFSSIGMSTIVLPKKIVSIACHQFIPPPISQLATMEVVVHKLIVRQTAAYFQVH